VQTWVVAAREVFFTWGLLGACIMQVTAHNRTHGHPLKSDAAIVVIVTTLVLLMGAFIGNACLAIIEADPELISLTYLPSSFGKQTYIIALF
jgi:hypothetical protein